MRGRDRVRTQALIAALAVVACAEPMPPTERAVAEPQPAEPVAEALPARALPAEAPAPTPPPADPPWAWPWERIESTVSLVRAGRDLTPARWPGGARVAVALSFDLD